MARKNGHFSKFQIDSQNNGDCFQSKMQYSLSWLLESWIKHWQLCHCVWRCLHRYVGQDCHELLLCLTLDENEAAWMEAILDGKTSSKLGNVPCSFWFVYTRNVIWKWSLFWICTQMECFGQKSRNLRNNLRKIRLCRWHGWESMNTHLSFFDVSLIISLPIIYHQVWHFGIKMCEQGPSLPHLKIKPSKMNTTTNDTFALGALSIK